MTKNDSLYIHALRSIDGIGNGTLEKLLAYFECGEHIWQASESELALVPNIGPNKRSLILAGRRTLDPDRLWEQLLALNISLLTQNDANYPKLLRQMPDAPQTVYTRGSHDWSQEVPMLAIVGSRKHSSYGMQVAEQLASDLTRSGILVISGLAFGIDSVAHKGALEAGGETIAILGSGIDDRMISPASHFQLAQKIIAHGALVSEYPPGTQASQGSFPMRDRIIAGLCLGTLVIEAPEKSGSLITAQCALEYNREVFAVPGSIFSPYSLGTNSLIKRGAKLVTGVQDILEELPAPQSLSASATLPSAEQAIGLSPDEHTLLTTLTHEPLHIDLIIKQTKLPTAQVSTLLSLLEIKGLAKNVGGMHYVRVAS